MLGVRHCAAARRVCVQGVAVRTGPLVLAAVRAARPAFAFGVAGRAAQLPAAPSRRPACPAPAGAVSAPRRLLSQKVEARVGEGYQKGQLDDSTELVMEVSSKRCKRMVPFCILDAAAGLPPGALWTRKQ